MAEYIETVPSDGVFRVNACSRCFRNEYLVDTDVLIEWEGTLALCVPCLKELLRAVPHRVKMKIRA